MNRNYLPFPLYYGGPLFSGAMSRILLVFFIWIMAGAGMAFAAVSVTAGSGGTGICSNKAVTGSVPAFSSLGSIVITEGANSDFSIGTDVIVLYPPTGWQFSSTVPTITYITGSNITGVSGSISGTALTINVTVVNTNGADQLTITGLQVQPLTTSASSGNIRASSVTGVAGITTGSSGTNFAALSATAPVTATISISGTPSGSICPGTAVTYTPTSTNGGTPTYYWALNGTDVSIGTTYTSSTLSSGNTITCRMLSSMGCLNANPVYSNTITATLLSAPAALSGSNIVCPGTTTTLSTTTTGGVWSSTNPSVGTVSTTGIVTGVYAGTTIVSYTAAGCAATKTIFVNNPPLAPVLTPTVATVCSGTSQAITATGTPASTTIISQNFNSGISPWTVDTIGSINILSGAEWKACADSYLNEQGWYRSPDYSSFAMANADTSGSASTLSTRLISPTFSLAEYSAATLTFAHAYDYWPAGDVNVNLDISTNGGTTWTQIINFKGATIGAKMSFVSQSFSLNAYLGNPNVKIRFYYKSSFGYYWAIDNVLITGTPSVVVPTWSPTTYLFTNAALTTAYTAGTAINTVYTYPTAVVTPTVITYTATATSATGGCTASATSIVTINPVPGATSGSLNLCIGSTSTLTNAAGGGTWLSGNASIATVGSGTGIVTGVAIGTASISYISGSSCATVVVVTVNSTPGAITGNLNACLGFTSTLTSATTGGTWTSSNTSVATVGSSTGLVSSIALGTARISYSLGGACVTSSVVTVHAVPAAITGTAEVCAGLTTTLSDPTPTGVWISGTTGIATVGYYTGVVTGVSGGIALISYAIPTTGCFASVSVTVNPVGPITGSANACIGATTALGNSATGGTWTSSITSVATIDVTTGVLTGVTTGTTTISYILPTGCRAYQVVTVNNLPSDISGPTSLCVGSTITLTNPTGGGTWSSSNTSVAGVGASTGIVNGVGGGTVMITYTAATTCIKTFTVTVNPPPAAITGSALICEGLTTTLSNASGGGTWGSSATSVATVSTSGVVSGIVPGTAVITYTLPTGCFGTRGVTVNSLPAAIAGTASLCQGATTTLTNTTSGGTWSSGTTVVASIASSSSGVVAGGAAGTANITYTLPTGCIATAVVTVNTIPGTLTGNATVCTGTVTTLTTSSSGGTWSSSNTTIATVGTSGSVSGLVSGTTYITYTLPTGCYATKLMTVYPSPATIAGVASVCKDQTTSLSSATTGGTWTSDNTSIATVISGSGVVSGLAIGTANIAYTVSTGCAASVVVTVLTLPATITGNLSVCLGATSALGNATSGGSWSSSASAIASVGSGSGIVSGAGLGMATITYTLSTGCYSTAMVVVNPMPSPITGTPSVCAGASVLLGMLTSGGTWSSSNSTVANASSGGGLVSGESAGIAIISYTLPTGCAATQSFTVNALPAAISGPNNICQSASATLANTISGGTWTSSTVGVATIGSSTGLMYGALGGGAVITYTLPTGCYAVMAVTITTMPATITGAGAVCQGSTILLGNVTSGGSWISSAPSVASISAIGAVTGLTSGTSLISYMLPIGCTVTKTVTVNPLPSAITGPTSICIAVPVTLSNATGGGVWSSSSPGIASINASTGLLTGYILSTAVISYTLLTGCNVTTVVTVNLTPGAISGAISICAGQTTPFTNVVSGGSWSSSNAAIASVGAASGVVTAASAGVATITYTLSSGCFVTKAISVNPVPSAITGPAAICQALSGTLASTTSGGAWSTSNALVATVGVTTGSVYGVTPGTTNITYQLPSGCLATFVLTVYALPASLTGTGSGCIGGTTMFSTTTLGGTWASGTPSVASVDADGVITGITTGTSIITYTLGIGCSIARTVTVNPLPPAITGSVPTCAGVNVTLGNTAPGGTWTNTTSPGIATVNASTGVVSPVSPGTAIITYTLGTGCYVTAAVIVNTVSPIIGSTALCSGSISTLSHATTGGTWSSSNTVVAGVSTSSGIAVGYTTGTSIISYIIPGGCVATKVATVSTLPSAISGPGNVCPGFTTTLSDATSGGSWGSTNASIATIGSASGTVFGITPGIVTISYVMPSGCGVARSFTVNSLPAAISGSGDICVGATSALTSGAPGGTWSSSLPIVAYVGPSTGIVTGVSSGTSVITYTPVSGCIATLVATVNSLPVTISGTTSLCAGSTGSLTNSTTGGVWNSSNPAIATIDAATGSVNAIMPGTSTISYTLGIGCASIVVITVNTMPGAILGVPSACVGYTTTLANTTFGGTWTSSNPSIASVNASTGVVTGIATGTATITFGFPTGCRVTVVATVSPVPATISGFSTVCVGSEITLSDPASGGGTWSNAATSIATVGAATGVVTGISPGTAAITYNIGSGCTVSRIVTVNAVPATITGIPSACVGLSTVLSCATPGGTWTSSIPAVATIDATTGIITGIATGISIVTYTVPSGCYATRSVSVNLMPGTTTGTNTMCVGSSTTLTNTTSGGVWSSASTGVATVNPSTGVVTGVSAGNTVITYLLGAGCFTTTTVTVFPLPSSISGAATVCQGLTSLFSNLTSGGTWTVTPGGIATIDGAGGLVTGMVAGTTTVTYTIGTGCAVTKQITVNPLVPNTGVVNTCIGFATTLSNSLSGGIWSSGAPLVASAGGLGIVTGLSAGTAPITYTLPTGCSAVSIVTVSAIAPLVGSSTVCAGQTITLSGSVTGGTWSSSNTAIAGVDVSSGLVSGIAAGTANISYTYGGGCIASRIITVQPLSPITGVGPVCVGQNSLFANATSGGTWSSSAATYATVGASTGMVTGVAAGAVTISYQLASGCIATREVTVNAAAAISGTSAICEGDVILFTNPVGPGAWSSSNYAVVNAASGTGTITGILAGAAVISYTLTSGCITTFPVTVNALPAAISGTANVCLGSSVTLANATSGGVWSSSSPTTATVSAGTGIVTGIASGTAAISYTVASGCYRIKVVTVNGLPSLITGATQVCFGATASLINTVPGGTWSSSNALVATVVASAVPGVGVVGGISIGTAEITYTLGSGCTTSTIVTVMPVPALVTGSGNVCVGATTLLSNATPGGSWSSTYPLVSVGAATGLVTGLSAGVANISYIISSGCFRTFPVTVHPLPDAISGATEVCVGSDLTLSNTTPGGSWNSGFPGIASVDPATGVVTGISTGTSLISYTLTTGCFVTRLVTVNPLPGAIVGPASVCQGLSATLLIGASGGTWSTGSPAIAAITSGGVISGVATGVAGITYSLPTGCISTLSVTVNPLPDFISGPSIVCAGQNITLSNATPGGAWISSSTSIASVDGVSGVVTGMAFGTTLITYALATGCVSTKVVSVNLSPAPISGSPQVCQGSSVLLSNITPGGAWAATTPAIATVSASGLVNGIAVGTSVISYTLPTGCASFKTVSVNPIPPPITGAVAICPGTGITLSNTMAGGSWSSSVASVATIDASGGMVSGIAAGLTVITYTMPSGCLTNAVIIVNPPPAAITGTAAACQGSGSVLADVTAGGTWVSSLPSVATIGSVSGVVTSVSAGVATISYVLPTGCFTTRQYTVNALPPAITGTINACLSASSLLTNAVPGGTWSSGATSVATVGVTSGVVTGVALGTASITYTLATGCKTSTIVTVQAPPAAIAGITHICQGTTTVLTDATPGGSWSSSNTLVATVGSSTGVVYSTGAGLTTISYTLYSGCSTAVLVTVDPLMPITGSSNVCSEDTVVYSNPVAGGIWSSSTIGVATVTPTGTVTGVVPGVAVISYLLPSGCLSTRTLTVNQLPVAFSLTGGGSFCIGAAGVPVGQSGSMVGFGYRLYNGTTSMAYVVGTGTALNYGVQTSGGIYTAVAVNLATGCSRAMVGAVTVTPVTIAPAGVSIVSTSGDTSCNGVAVTYSPVTFLGGTAPAFIWKVNGTVVSGASSYTYSPLSGDIITCHLSSSASCALPSTATSSLTMTVLPVVVPAVSVTVLPGDTVCQLTTASFTALPVNGGSLPVYRWLRNGITAGSGTAYSYVPSDGDVIKCAMAANSRCRSIDTAFSDAVNMSVLPYLTPSVTISAVPGFNILAGTEITFTAAVVNGGASPLYQWAINHVPLGGATNATFTWSSFVNKDTISCTVTSTGACSGIATTAKEEVIVQSVGISGIGAGAGNLTLIPNPNAGAFVLKGQLPVTTGLEASILITDMLGREVYSERINIAGGKINKQITTVDDLVNGIYLLSLNTSEEHYILHFVLKR